jgi:hypothetical protein
VKQLYNFPRDYKKFSFYFEHPLSNIFMEESGLAKRGMDAKEIVFNLTEEQEEVTK